MSHSAEIEAVERRAFAARLRVNKVCERAGVLHSTWSRAKTRGTIDVETLAKMEGALDAIEAERAGA